MDKPTISVCKHLSSLNYNNSHIHSRTTGAFYYSFHKCFLLLLLLLDFSFSSLFFTGAADSVALTANEVTKAIKAATRQRINKEERRGEGEKDKQETSK